ncbi:protein mono-ADP-ribosyltransferase PARP16 isoform X3 [Rhinatrema bivittatum]|uniref:protein mono-ADP-ribosyltransferase PARP16 isoform X3 n=1 Tax=Rhinatrema bivittatum TaxID=194408 RepID=UPI00112B6B3E|nr:protein mono-ADP-ribosyltransferase PARP16 isoform X3 [Rhinatrema bivittatum]
MQPLVNLLGTALHSACPRAELELTNGFRAVRCGSRYKAWQYSRVHPLCLSQAFLNSAPTGSLSPYIRHPVLIHDFLFWNFLSVEETFTCALFISFQLADTNTLPNFKAFLESGYEPDKRARDLLTWVLSSKTITIKSAKKNETSLFGEGTYLTSDLSLALLYSPYGQGWQHSLLGSRLSCVAVCEVIDHPDVKCQVKKKDSKEQDRKRARVQNSEGGDVPQKYFVVTNNQVVRVKYFLLYSQKQHRQRTCSPPSWFSRHRFAVLMSLYLLLLVVIGISNSPAFLYYWNRAFQWKR